MGEKFDLLKGKEDVAFYVKIDPLKLGVEWLIVTDRGVYMDWNIFLFGLGSCVESSLQRKDFLAL